MGVTAVKQTRSSPAFLYLQKPGRRAETANVSWLPEGQYILLPVPGFHYFLHNCLSACSWRGRHQLLYNLFSLSLVFSILVLYQLFCHIHFCLKSMFGIEKLM